MRTWIVMAAMAMGGLAGARGAIGMADADEVAEPGAVARSMLARELKVPGDRVKVLDMTPVDWPDSSLGCPEKDKMYAQMITSGHRVRLEVDGAPYEVHVAGTRAVRCGPAGPASPGASPPASAGTSSSYPAAAVRVSRLARKDLANHLGLPVARVKVSSVRPTTWPDARLGCPGPAPTEPKPVTGFIVQLRASGKTYRYHADEQRAVRCH